MIRADKLPHSYATWQELFPTAFGMGQSRQFGVVAITSALPLKAGLKGANVRHRKLG
jgi:hypothetical protein